MPSIQVGSGTGMCFWHLPVPPSTETVAKLSYYLGMLCGNLEKSNKQKYEAAIAGIIRVVSNIELIFCSHIVPTKDEAVFITVILEVVRMRYDLSAPAKEYAEALHAVRDWFVAVVDRYEAVS